MVLDTFSIFYTNDPVTNDNLNIPFDEGSGELNGQIAIGAHSASELATQVQTALNSAGTLIYTVTFDRDTRQYTISTSAAFDLLISTGATAGQSAFSLLGFTGAVDLTGATSYTSDSAAGEAFEPQFILQSFVDKDEDQRAAQASINKAADGSVEVISFGTEKFISFDINFITNLPMDNKFIKSNSTGREDAISFLQSITRKNRFEFMKDIATRATFDKVILESVSGFRDGTGYRLKELTSKNLRDIYEVTGFKLRVVE